MGVLDYLKHYTYAGYKVADDTILRSDVAFICDEPHDACITKAPEIAIEVISASTA